MDGSRMLAGTQLVAKGATKRVDGQLPEVGLKDVSPNGSWLEQKQIQSALEARKHLIAVERIEKSGSLSHAIWREDLKLAEVTKQTGGQWQYIGHKRGNSLYLLPEEVLFLIETNSLLLKHNEVTVSLQKAYALCLGEMPIIQYKVYASLSRLGYRVFRHKEPTFDKNNVQTAAEPTKENTATAMEISSETSQTVSMNTETANPESANSIENNAENNMEVFKNDYSESVQNDPNNLTKKEPPEDISVNNEDTTTNKQISVNDNTEKVTTSTINDKTSEQNIEKPMLTLEVVTNKNNAIEDVAVPRMDIDDYAHEPIVITNCKEDSMVTNGEESTAKETAADEIPNSVILADVYSVDEFGLIRVFDKNTPMETDSNVMNATTNSMDCTHETEETTTNDSFKHYLIELKLYDNKIKKLTEKKSNNKISRQGLDTMQDFYKQQIVKINVPDEKYLPRNIFLHKTEYILNMEVVATQNASNITNDETDSVESVSTPSHGTNSQRVTDMPRLGSFNTNTPPRYPTYQHHRTPYYNPRINFNNFMLRNIPSFYGDPKYQPEYYSRQHYIYNVSMPGANNFHNQPDRREVIKKYHYDMICNIAMRLKNGHALPAQVQALQNLLNTYNLRYNTHIRMTQDFTIIETPEPVHNQNVIVLDDDKVRTLDEPKRKKQRLNDNNVKYKNNMEELKELAAKLKELHTKNLATSRHRRVFSNALKSFNKLFNADLYLNDNFEILDRKTVVVDTSSDSDAVIVEEREKPKKRKKLRNPYSILKRIPKGVNVGASTSSQVPVLRTLSLNVINDNTSQHFTSDDANIASTVVEVNDEDLLMCFYKARFVCNNDFGGPELCSRVKARLDALLFQADNFETLHEVSEESLAQFKSWVDLKLAALKDIRGCLNLQKQQVEALSNDFFTTESQSIIGRDCTDLRTALKKLAIIPTNKEVPAETSLRIHFDVCNRDIHFKKSNPPKPSFRVVCYMESALFPSTGDVVALQAKYTDGVPTVFAFVGISASISYLQINPIDLPVFIPDSYLA